MRARFACSMRSACCGSARLCHQHPLAFHIALPHNDLQPWTVSCQNPCTREGAPVSTLPLHQPSGLASPGRGEAHPPRLLQWPHRLAVAPALCLRAAPTHPPPHPPTPTWCRCTMPAAYPKAWRAAAAVAFFVGFYLSHNLGYGPAFKHAIAARFRRACPDHTVSPGYAYYFALYWAWKFWTTGGVEEDPRRRPNMPDEVAINVGKLLYKGYYLEVEEWRGKGAKKRCVTILKRFYYRSMHEFIERNPDVREIMRIFNIKDEGTLHRTLKRVADRIPRAPKGLERLPMHPKAPLPPDHKKERFRVAKDLLGLGFGCSVGTDPLIHYLSRVCWIDSKTFYIEPREELVYAPLGADLTSYDPRVPQQPRYRQKITYYIVVNALLGPVYYERVTGTTDREEDPHYKEYMVSVAPCLPPSQLVGTCVGYHICAAQGSLHRAGPLYVVLVMQPHQPLPLQPARCIHLPVPRILHLPGHALIAPLEVLPAIHFHCHPPLCEIDVKALVHPLHQVALKCERAQPLHQLQAGQHLPQQAAAKSPACQAPLRALGPAPQRVGEEHSMVPAALQHYLHPLLRLSLVLACHADQGAKPTPCSRRDRGGVHCLSQKGRGGFQ